MNSKNSFRLPLFLSLIFTILVGNPTALFGHLNKLESLVTCEDLNELQSQKNVGIRLFDVRKSEAFEIGHIEGAVQIWRPDYADPDASFDGKIASKSQIESLLSNFGIHPSDQIILYDAKGNCDAARVWWILKYYGHENVSILDGGYFQWERNQYATTTSETSTQVSKYNFPNEIKRDLIISKADVLSAVQQESSIILDTRSTEEFEGQIQKSGASAKGNIPSSVHFDWINCIENESKKFKSKEKLMEMVQSIGLKFDDQIITYCHSGVRSAHTLFVLTELLGFQNVMNYDGSWVEWSQYLNESTIAENMNTSEIASQAVSYWDIFLNSFKSFGSYTWNEITFQAEPIYVNYFWWLIILSLVVWGLEIAFPWRKNQPIIRKDFWIDAFYMFFNFYIFKLVIFMAFSNVTEQAVKDIFGGSLSQFAIVDLQGFSWWMQLLIFFIATDFIQWFTHVMLHRFDFLWKFHKVHHSVEEMGFAAHLRYHWMENVFYTPMKYIMVMLLGGFTPDQAFIVFYVAIAIGHLNHANINLTYGPLKYIINNPVMHIWHHSFDWPKDRQKGANFGISLSLWDYIFKTAYIPRDGRDIKLGFPGIEKFPKKFKDQLFYGFFKRKG